MMKDQPVIRDERYYAVENASYRIGFIILMYGLMVLIIIRSIAFQESNWDLFALIIISSFAATIYQFAKKIIVFSWRYVYISIAAAVLAALLAFGIGLLLK
jgi:hypothetical protein